MRVRVRVRVRVRNPNPNPNPDPHPHPRTLTLTLTLTLTRFLREPLLAAGNLSAAASPLARDRSPALSGDLHPRWRYLPRGPNPIPAFGTPMTEEAEGYCDAAELQLPAPSARAASMVTSMAERGATTSVWQDSLPIARPWGGSL